jgi:hypothetical protein
MTVAGGILSLEAPLVRSTRDVVLLQGVLKQMRREIPCTVRAVKVCLWTLGISEYVEAEVVDAPSELPDGDYQVGFEGRSMKVHKTSGHWETSAI